MRGYIPPGTRFLSRALASCESPASRFLHLFQFSKSPFRFAIDPLKTAENSHFVLKLASISEMQFLTVVDATGAGRFDLSAQPNQLPMEQR